jgi:hypothetical protein
VEPDDFPPPAPETLDTVLHALIAQLFAAGLFRASDLTAIAKRLDFSEMPEAAERIRQLPLSDAMIDPASIRSGFTVVDGGNGTD